MEQTGEAELVPVGPGKEGTHPPGRGALFGLGERGQGVEEETTQVRAVPDRQAVERSQYPLPGLQHDADHGAGFVIVAAGRGGGQQRHAVRLSAAPGPGRVEGSRHCLGIRGGQLVVALRLAAQHGRRGGDTVQVADHGVGGAQLVEQELPVPPQQGDHRRVAVLCGDSQLLWEIGVFDDDDAGPVDGRTVDADAATPPVDHLHALRLESAHRALDLFARRGQLLEAQDVSRSTVPGSPSRALICTTTPPAVSSPTYKANPSDFSSRRGSAASRAHPGAA